MTRLLVRLGILREVWGYEGAIVPCPRWWAPAFVAWDRDVMYIAPMPLNFAIGYARKGFYLLLRGLRPGRVERELIRARVQLEKASRELKEIDRILPACPTQSRIATLMQVVIRARDLEQRFQDARDLLKRHGWKDTDG